jgi:hypothetical protein
MRISYVLYTHSMKCLFYGVCRFIYHAYAMHTSYRTACSNAVIAWDAYLMSHSIRMAYAHREFMYFRMPYWIKCARHTHGVLHGIRYSLFNWCQCVYRFTSHTYGMPHRVRTPWKRCWATWDMDGMWHGMSIGVRCGVYWTSNTYLISHDIRMRYGIW